MIGTSQTAGLWLQAWRQQLPRPGTCSRTWLAFGYVLIRPSRGHKHMQQVLSECTQRPKGQLCAPSVSKRISISGGAGSCLGSGASPRVIRRGCQGRVRRSGGRGRRGGLRERASPTSAPRPRPRPCCSHFRPKLTLNTGRKVKLEKSIAAVLKWKGSVAIDHVKVSHFYVIIFLLFHDKWIQTKQNEQRSKGTAPFSLVSPTERARVPLSSCYLAMAQKVDSTRPKFLGACGGGKGFVLRKITTVLSKCRVSPCLQPSLKCSFTESWNWFN